MNDARNILYERKNEIDLYLNLLSRYDEKIKNDIKNIDIEPNQYRILMAHSLIMIYSMIEATIMKAIEYLEKSIERDSDFPDKLHEGIKISLIKRKLGLKFGIHEDKLTKNCLQIFDNMINKNLKMKFYVSKYNWNDEVVYKFFNNIGVKLDFSDDIIIKIKKEETMNFILRSRNALAHGEISFSECADDYTLERIKEIFINIVAYLEELLNMLENYIEKKDYLQ